MYTHNYRKQYDTCLALAAERLVIEEVWEIMLPNQADVTLSDANKLPQSINMQEHQSSTGSAGNLTIYTVALH